MFRLLPILLLAGCATVLPYVGHGSQPQTDEVFVRWEDDLAQACEKRLIVDNPLSHGVVVHFDCTTEPLIRDVAVPAHSTKMLTIHGSQRLDANREVCHEYSYDIVR